MGYMHMLILNQMFGVWTPLLSVWCRIVIQNVGLEGGWWAPSDYETPYNGSK